MLNNLSVRRRIAITSSWGVMGLLLASTATQAIAQDAVTTTSDQSRAPETDGSDANDAGSQVITVVGTRAAQQSGNDRKRNAKTATDSIVADDIGSFPDRNVNEALSRLPGVALERNEFGEGSGVAVRGNGLDLTRVELDGIGVQSTTALSLGADGGRSADLTALPAELVKSIDVVKGSTADMTEGSLGGTIQIKTRTGLDFARPYLSVRVGGERNSLGREITPDGNVVAATQLFGGRLGLLGNVTYRRIQNNSHGMEMTTSNNRHYNRLWDLDNSPEKTFAYNPDTVGTDRADVAMANSTSGVGGVALTPRQLVGISAAAQSKGDCAAAFPLIATPASGDTTARQNQRIQRVRELNSCLNQWNDYTPSLLRDFMTSQEEERYAIDLRADFELTDDLIIWGKYNRSDRIINDQNRSRNPVADLVWANPAGYTTVGNTGTPRIRGIADAAPPGFYLYNTGSSYAVNGTSGTPAGGRGNAIAGNVLNVVPGSVVVDEAHNVTAMTLTNSRVSIDQISNDWNNKTSYIQAGADYNTDRLEVNFMAGMTNASSSRTDKRSARGFTYGDAQLALQPSGLWAVEYPEGYDPSNPDQYVQLNAPLCVTASQRPPSCIGQAAVDPSYVDPDGSPAYTVGQMPLTTRDFSVIYRPRAGESSEQIAKLDLAFETEDLVPFFTRIKVGGQYRRQEIASWGGGGRTVQSAQGVYGQPGYVPAIVVPSANVDGVFRGCQETPGSQAAGGLSCNYGFVPNSALGEVRSGTDTLTPDQLRQLFASTIEKNDSTFFNGFPGGGTLPQGWEGVDIDKLFAALGANQFLNLDCLKQCVGSDGQVYDQPVNRSNETTMNVYGMVEFEQPLPLELEFNGNVGVRGVFREVNSVGSLDLETIRLIDPSNPLGATYTVSYTENVDFTGKLSNWLPTFNFNLWGFDEQVALRFYGGKTVANVPVTRLSPAGDCTIDERNVLEGEDGDVFGCGGRIGNPDLDPFTAWNYNISAEWYPNRDTLFSVAYHRLDVQIGAPRTVTVDRNLFAGSNELDPITGQPLSNLVFSVPTYENGPGYKRSGLEFQAKTAFTFLPWIFRYLGADWNYSTLTSDTTEGGIRDPLSGDYLPPENESADYMNTSLWYDDGKLNIRLTHQKRSSVFTCVTPCGGNSVSKNYPGDGWTNVDVSPDNDGWNPGVARYTDGSTFIDGKISYYVLPNIQLYVEGRNLTREARVTSTGGFENFADGTPRVFRVNYGGRRFMAGITARFGGNRR